MPKLRQLPHFTSYIEYTNLYKASIPIKIMALWSVTKINMYSKIVRYLYSKLPSKSKEISRSELLEDYYNNKYPTVPVFYNGRILIGSNTRFKVDVRNFFTLNDGNLNNIVKSLKLSSQTDNQKALTCLKYIIKNVPYKSDLSNYKKGEFWCMPYETLNKGSGDCEDQAILLANLLLISGIPNWKVRISTGWVFEPISKKQIGHAYLTFFDEENEKWVILDTSFYPNLMRIIDREEYKKEKMYQEIWFSFNDKMSWSTNPADVRNMEGVESF